MIVQIYAHRDPSGHWSAHAEDQPLHSPNPILPQGVRARLDPQAWPRPGVYPWIQKLVELPEEEMLRVFNCGIGMVLIVPQEHTEDIIQRLQGLGERAYLIGETLRKGSDDEPPLWFDPGSTRRK